MKRRTKTKKIVTPTSADFIEHHDEKKEVRQARAV